MSATYIGYSGSSLITEITYEEDKSGLATYTQKTLADPQSSVATPSLTKTISIDGQVLRMVSVNVTSGSGNFKEIQEVFQGQSSTRTLQQNATNATGEEPIETNYNFLVSHDASPSIVELSGGALTQGDSVNATSGGTVFDANGKFLYFNKNSKNNLFGITSYLNPNLTYRRSFTTETTPSLTAVGKIIIPTSDFPSAVTNATWLCTSIQYVQRGKTFEVTHDFRSSDKKGWNEYIYGSPVAAPSTS